MSRKSSGLMPTTGIINACEDATGRVLLSFTSWSFLTSVLLSLTKGSSTGDQEASGSVEAVGSGEGEITAVGEAAGDGDNCEVGSAVGEGAGEGVFRYQTAEFELEELKQADENSAKNAKMKTALFLKIINFRISKF